MRRQWEAVQAYVMARIKIVPSGCWEWQRHRNSLGYGQCGFGGRTWIVTRLMYSATQGDFDPKLDICHTCDNPPCVNPLHLWLGSRSRNIQDSVDKGRHFLAAATHCKRGHPFSGENVYVRNDGKRVCRICETARGRMSHGWPEDLAFSLPIQALGFRPPSIAIGGPQKRKGPKTHCVNGHPLSGDNLYIVPSDGRRQCRTCKLHVVQRLAAERRQVNGT
jgi:hypothetical protein